MIIVKIIPLLAFVSMGCSINSGSSPAPSQPAQPPTKGNEPVLEGKASNELALKDIAFTIFIKEDADTGKVICQIGMSDNNFPSKFAPVKFVGGDKIDCDGVEPRIVWRKDSHPHQPVVDGYQAEIPRKSSKVYRVTIHKDNSVIPMDIVVPESAIENIQVSSNQDLSAGISGTWDQALSAKDAQNGVFKEVGHTSGSYSQLYFSIQHQPSGKKDFYIKPPYNGWSGSFDLVFALSTSNFLPSGSNLAGSRNGFLFKSIRIRN